MNPKNHNCSLLAPIVVEIIMCRGSAHNIATESGTILSEKPNLSAPNYLFNSNRTISNSLSIETFPFKTVAVLPE